MEDLKYEETKASAYLYAFEDQKNKNDNRRQFLKNTSLSLLSFAVFPTIIKSQNSTVSLSKKNFTVNCDESTEDLYGQGPFYTANAPSIQNNQLADNSEAGTRIIISGLVYNIECSEVIPNTEIDIWHANDAGGYDNLGYNLRGKTTTNSQGFYVFESIKPGLYLNGATFRPSHIHFKITIVIPKLSVSLKTKMALCFHSLL